jgi:S1-C subfamily serine protease
MHRIIKYKKKIVQVALSVKLAIAMLFGIVFGVGVLTNYHSTYLRYKMKDVVLIHSFSGGGGTGSIVKLPSGKNAVLTNGHVCKLAQDGVILVNYLGNDYVSKVIEVYPKHDLCIVESPSQKGGLSIASSVDMGEKVFAMGHPLLEPNTITHGELSGVVNVRIAMGYNVPKAECSGEGYELINAEQSGNPMMSLFGILNVCIRSLDSNASTVIILPGNSGSPTVNIYGNIVAVVFAANESGTRSYHVPLKEIKAFLKDK